MIFSESTNIAVGRIGEIEPRGAYKMVECLLSLGWGDREMTQLTLSPDDVVQNMITKVKNILDFDGVILREPYPENYNPSALPKLGAKRAPRRLFSLSELPSNICQYFRKGFCRHGSNCKYLHDVSMTVLISQFSNLNSNDDHHFFRAGSIEVLGMEITELLRSRNGNPIPVHLLPATYYGMYGKTIETKGYHNLVKLLTHMKNILCVIDRYEGLILVILACDAVNYMTHASARNENGCIVPRSRQIYLTFPSESSFTAIDLFNYFSAYGPVQDVRIPCQEKRMFAFVAFVYPEPVQKLLALAKPHFISGSRVLVKPYKEKSRLTDRNHLEMLQRSIPSDLQSFGRGSEYTVPNAGDNSSVIKNGPAEDIIETVDPKNRPAESLVLINSNSDDELKLPEEPSEFRFPLHPRSGIRKKFMNSGTTNNSDQERDGIINLPDSLFASYMNRNSD